MRVIVTGGGTAGHVLPAIAIADALAGRGHEVEVVGSARGIDGELYGETPYRTHLLPGRGIQRRLTAENIRAVTGLARAGTEAWAIVGRYRPHAVVAVGGYASVACGLAGGARRVPLIVHEQNAVPGAANRLLARMARAAAVSFPDTDLPRPVVVGNPVRAAFFARPPRTGDGRDRPARILAFGGSLGALSINRAVIGAVEAWRGRTDLVVRHVVGRRDWPVLQIPDPDDLDYTAVEYENDMVDALHWADLAVCRAGSSTCFELAASGTPALMIPSEVTTGGQQIRNAERVQSTGGAVVLADADLTAARLVSEVDALIADTERLDTMAKQIAELAAPGAAAAVADLVEDHAGR